MNIKKEFYGKTKNGESVDLYEISSSKGISVSIITYGGIITSIKMPDKNGHIGEINLGFDSLDRYENDSRYFGAILGRFSNRIANGKFNLDGKKYSLALNDNKVSHLHGGVIGYDKIVWSVKEIKNKESVGIKLNYKSKDGEEGYPGNVDIEVDYILTENSELTIDYFATTDKSTPINLTNHAYWNLAGKGDVKNHELELNADFYLPSNDHSIPTGEILMVKNTPMDFTKPKIIGSEIEKLKGSGYDHCYIVNKINDGLNFTARVYEPTSGRCLEIYTTKPAVQFYSGNYLNDLKGRENELYNKNYGFCLETEYYPDAVNHTHFPTCILKPGEEYKYKTVHKLFVK
jgi:aldose 1-epimerase